MMEWVDEIKTRAMLMQGGAAVEFIFVSHIHDIHDYYGLLLEQ